MKKLDDDELLALLQADRGQRRWGVRASGAVLLLAGLVVSASLWFDPPPPDNGAPLWWLWTLALGSGGSGLVALVCSWGGRDA